MINDDDRERFTPTPFMLAHRPAATNKKRGYARKTASPENATRARLDMKHIARSNICPVCHLAMPATGECC